MYLLTLHVVALFTWIAKNQKPSKSNKSFRHELSRFTQPIDAAWDAKAFWTTELSVVHKTGHSKCARGLFRQLFNHKDANNQLINWPVSYSSMSLCRPSSIRPRNSIKVEIPTVICKPLVIGVLERCCCQCGRPALRSYVSVWHCFQQLSSSRCYGKEIDCMFYVYSPASSLNRWRLAIMADVYR